MKSIVGIALRLVGLGIIAVSLPYVSFYLLSFIGACPSGASVSFCTLLSPYFMPVGAVLYIAGIYASYGRFRPANWIGRVGSVAFLVCIAVAYAPLAIVLLTKNMEYSLFGIATIPLGHLGATIALILMTIGLIVDVVSEYNKKKQPPSL